MDGPRNQHQVHSATGGMETPPNRTQPVFGQRSDPVQRGQSQRGRCGNAPFLTGGVYAQSIAMGS